MSVSALRQRNRGCYSSPFSGVGMEFFPLDLMPDHSGLLLHEAGYLARNDWWVFRNTLSPFWRLYFNGRPGHKVVFPQAEYELTPEHLVLIPDHQLFHSIGRGPVPHTWLTFRVAGRLAPEQPVPILLRPTATERKLLEELAGQFNGIGTGNRNRVLHVSLALLHLVLSRPGITWQVKAPPESLLQTIRYMEAHHAQPLEVGQLARMAGLSVRGFGKAFKRQEGVSPVQFLIRTRVREAADLLANGELGLDLIAETTGFPNRDYLSRMFKRVMGDSPAHFRREHREHPA